MLERGEPIIVEQSFNRPIGDVWRAITEINRMHQWYFDNIPSFQAVPGFKTQFSIINEGRSFLHMWEIKEVEPFKRISYSWKFQEYPGEGLVIFELSEQNGSTILKLTNLGLETFPDNIPEFKRESCIGGWQYFIQHKLKEYLESIK